MTLVYDKKLFETFRKKAITEKNNLKIGHTYYTDIKGKVKLLRFLTINEVNALKHVPYRDKEDEEIKAFLYEKFNECKKSLETGVMYLKDNNIGASYNPWLIFDNEEDYIMKKEQLTISC
jgi:hypothetical protein